MGKSEPRAPSLPKEELPPAGKPSPLSASTERVTGERASASPGRTSPSSDLYEKPQSSSPLTYESQERREMKLHEDRQER